MLTCRIILSIVALLFIQSVQGQAEKGLICLPGKRGERGERGPRGPRGPQGDTGPQGADSTVAGPPANFNNGFFRNSAGVLGVLDQGILPFTAVTTSGVTLASSGHAQVQVAGIYLVSFTVYAVPGPFAVAIFVDGNLVPNTEYRSILGNQQVIGQALISLSAGADVTLRNVSGAIIDLVDLLGPNNVSIVLDQVGVL